ncbi:MAG: FmdB family transcriptional regulator [Chloroflexi bacterium]|nr:FmdB family transcriptional regulator [Chloroflexota bacterium]
MPTYDYQCRSCGFITEVVHSMLEDGPTECERCGGQLRRVFHPTGIIFKGGGFYKTDSRSASSGSVAGSGRSGSTGSGEAGAAVPSSADGGAGDKGSAPKTGDGPGKSEGGSD